MKYKKPTQGTTIHCWKSGELYAAHNNHLFLGEDRTGKERVLVPSPALGWDIINLEDFPEGFYRPLGRCNIVEEVKDEIGVLGYTYKFFDNQSPIDISVKLHCGYWVISSDYPIPSWMKKPKEKKYARGPRSKKTNKPA